MFATGKKSKWYNNHIMTGQDQPINEQPKPFAFTDEQLKANPSLANLHVFKPGVSGNPKGKTPGTTSFKTALNNYLDGIITEDEVIKRMGKLGFNRRDALCIKLLKIALSETSSDSDSIRAIDQIIDRVDGKPRQEIDHTTKGEPLNKQIDLSKLTDEELQNLAILHDKISS